MSSNPNDNRRITAIFGMVVVALVGVAWTLLGELDGGQAAWIIFLTLAGVGAIGYFNLTPQGPGEWQRLKADRAKRSAKKFNEHMQTAQYKKTPISQAGVHGPTGLACPKCGGVQFEPGRSTAGAFGSSKRRKLVSCVTCGTVFRRG